MLKIPSLLVIVLLLLSACNTSKNFTFAGETKHWSAELKVSQDEFGYEKQEIELHYKGKDVNSVGEITYDVDTNAGGFGGSGLTLKENGTLKGSSDSNPSNAKVTENSEAKVTVKWNRNKETILLRNN